MDTTDSSSSYDDSDESCSSSGEVQDAFQIMKLPVEVRAKIFNMLNQKVTPCLRSVCKQWKSEVEEFFEFALNLDDTRANLARVKNLRYRECIIWKLTDTNQNPPWVFHHPTYLKVLKIFGPVHSDNLRAIITAAVNLEHLQLSRRCNFPWVLNLKDTPGLNNLSKLKLLRVNSEEKMQVHSDKLRTMPLPLMDCNFEGLQTLDLTKRFPVSQYVPCTTTILEFVARHGKSLVNLEIEMMPLYCMSFNDDDTVMAEESDDESSKKNDNHVVLEKSHLTSLTKLNLHKFSVTTKGCDKDIHIWKSILDAQSNLQELRFDWLYRDPRTDVRVRTAGFPWIYFQVPVERCAHSLVRVELTNLSMLSHQNSSRIMPFDLAIFRNCTLLKSLQLRCQENHATSQEEMQQQRSPETENNNDDENEQAVPEAGSAIQLPFLINAMDLPTSLEIFEIYWLPILTTDLEAFVCKCLSLRKLFLHECGKTGNLGVSADVLRHMASLTLLKFLEIIGFNASTHDKKQELETVFQSIGVPFEGQDTWLELDDGSSSAYESLKCLLTPKYCILE